MKRDPNQHPVTSEIANGQISEDQAMATAFKRGDRGAYRVIYSRYEARVEGVCRRMLRDKEDAREATQETFLRVYQGLGRFNGRYQMGAWIARIAMNVCLDHIRLRQRRPAISLVDEVPEAKLKAYENGPEEALLTSNESDRVRETLASLPSLHRAAMVLREYEGLSYAEIGEALSISEAQVKALLHRARNRFRKSWERSAVSALLPWRIIQKIRHSRASNQNASVGSSLPSVADSVGSSAQWMTTCATAIQSCAPAVGERAAVLFTAFVVGAASASGAAPARSQDMSVAVNSVDVRDLADGEVDQHNPGPARRRSAAIKPTEQIEEGATTSEPEAPPSGPAPPDDDTTVPDEGEPDDEGTTDGPDPVATPTPTPTSPGTMVSVAFEQGQTTAPVAPVSNKASVDCAAFTFDQALSTTLSYNGVTYPVAVDVKILDRIDITMTVTTRNGNIVYGGGSPTTSWETDQKRAKVLAQGPYSWSGGIDPNSGGMPRYGRFNLTLVLDCIAPSVITESLRFTTG